MGKVYQPIARNFIDEETLPYDLFSFQAFESREDCEEWLERHGYEIDDWDIIEYDDEDDIIDVMIIDEYGNIV